MFGFSDTGQWRLIVYLSATGMQAYLKHASDASRPIEKVLDTSWGLPGRKEILKKIEETVFDNPALLDDYATEIIIETPRTLFAPMEVLDSEDSAEETIFSTIFPGSENEMIIDRIDDIAVLFSLTPGLEGFISRTIPGARLRSHLAVLTQYFAGKNTDATRIYVDLRSQEIGNTAGDPAVKEMDIIAFDRKKLLSASTHEWETTEDMAYNILHLIRAYDLRTDEVEINISGKGEEKGKLMELLRKFCSYVVLTTLPASGKELPLAARISSL